MSKLKKLLIVIFAVITIGFSFAQGAVWADLSEIDTLKFLSYLHQVVFFVLWPFVSLAWLALSNKFVTGDAVGLGETIFAFWASMKTFAFFVIGFMFVGGVLAYMIGIGKGKSSPKELITKLILAVIGIPLSYWLFLLLLDLSTILTISVGALPLKIGAATDVTVPNVAPHVKITTWGVAVYYEVSAHVKEGNDAILGEKIVSCVFEGWTLSFTGTQKLAQETKKAFNSEPDINDKYCLLSMNRVVAGVKDWEWKSYQEVLENSREVAEAKNTLGAYMSNPLTPLFTSLLNLSSTLEVSATQTLGKQIFQFLLNLLISLALFIPLAVLAVVLLIRWVVLRALIAFAPFLLLAWIFGFKWWDAQGRYSISSVLWLIFLPVTVVFAISLSLIFLSSISKIDSNGQEQIFTAMGFESENGELKYSISKDVGISLSQESDNIDFRSIWDFFALLFKVWVGIALMWIIVFAALKTTKITEGVVSGVQGFAEGYLKSLRVIPVPGMGMMSVGGIQRWLSQVTQTVPGELIQKQYSAQVEPILDEVKARFAGGSEDRKSLSKLDSQLANKKTQEAIPTLSSIFSKGLTSTAADLNTFHEKNMAFSGYRNFWAKTQELTGKTYKDLGEAIQDAAFVALFAPELKQNWTQFSELYKKATNKDLNSIEIKEEGNLKSLGEDEVLKDIYYIPGRFPESVIMKDPNTGDLLLGDDVWKKVREKIAAPELRQTLKTLAKAKDPDINFDNIAGLDDKQKAHLRAVLEEVATKLYGWEKEIAERTKEEIIQEILSMPNESSSADDNGNESSGDKQTPFSIKWSIDWTGNNDNH